MNRHIRRLRAPQRNPQRGFTYMGLLVMIAIIGIVSAAAVSVGAIVQRRDAEEELLFIGQQFRRAFQLYYESTPPGQRRHPAALAELLKDPRYPEIRRYLRRIYVDPLTGRDDWVPVVAPEGGIMGVHSRSAAQPIKIANFPEEFRTFENQSTYAQWIFFYR